MPMPDAELYPHATGLAKATADKHSEPQDLKLYSGWFCPFVQRIWAVLEEKNIPFQYIEENPYHKSERLLRLNPRGLVPTLDYGGKPLYESVVVAEFLEDVYPDHGPRLRPEDPYQRAVARIWTDFVTSRILPSYHRLLQHQPAQGDIQEKRDELLGHLKTWTKALDPTGPYFFGEQPMLVDFALAPWAVRMWVFDEFKGGLGIAEEGKGGDEEELWERWHKWHNAIANRKSIKETTSEKDKYLPIYKKYADDIAQSEMAKAIRQGKPVP